MNQTTLKVGTFARLDLERMQRTAFPEVIYAPGKTRSELLDILSALRDRDVHNVMISKLQRDVFEEMNTTFPDAEYYVRSSSAVFFPKAHSDASGDITIVTAGTSDLAVAEEAEIACRLAGSSVRCISDVGVAGVHRLLDVLPDLVTSRVIICVAGMEAALPSLLTGLVPVPVIGLPVSIGYGVNMGGWNALLSMLGSCAPGLLVVNIDNGIGAAAAAHRINIASEYTRHE